MAGDLAAKDHAGVEPQRVVATATGTQLHDAHVEERAEGLGQVLRADLQVKARHLHRHAPEVLGIEPAEQVEQQPDLVEGEAMRGDPAREARMGDFVHR